MARREEREREEVNSSREGTGGRELMKQVVPGVIRRWSHLTLNVV
jgi:hypothetical protein